MKRSIPLLLAVTLTNQSIALAADNEFNHEVEGSTSAEFIISDHKNSGYDIVRPTTIDAQLGYSFAIRTPFQISSDFKVFHETNLTRYQVHVGPTFNFLGHSVEDSCFVGAAFGISHFSWSDQYGFLNESKTTTFSAVIHVGVRIPITTHISWKPNVQYYWQTSGNDNAWVEAGFSKQSLSIIPLSFALLF